MRKADPSAPCLLPCSFSFSRFSACLSSSSQWPKEKFKFLISSREPGGRHEAPNTGNHVERISYLLQFPYYFPSPCLHPHLQPRSVSELFPAAEEGGSQLTFALQKSGSHRFPSIWSLGWRNPTPLSLLWLNGEPLGFTSLNKSLGRSWIQAYSQEFARHRGER